MLVLQIKFPSIGEWRTPEGEIYNPRDWFIEKMSAEREGHSIRELDETGLVVREFHPMSK